MKKSQKPRVYIEALPLTTKKVSGIGHMLASMVYELSQDKYFTAKYDLVLFGPKSGRQRIHSWQFQNFSYQNQPAKQRIITALNFAGLLPPIDLWLGKGIYLFANYTNYPLSAKSKSITYVHDFCFKRFPEYVQPKVRAVLSANLPKWIKRTDKIITVSRHAKKELGSFYGQADSKALVIPNGVDLKVFYHKNAKEVNQVRQKYGLGQKEKYILYLGNIEPRKNLERLILAYCQLDSSLRSKHPLVIAGGDGWLNEPIRQAIKKAKKDGCHIIQPEKYVEDQDLPALFSGAIMLAHPAIYEGFGISVLQAMACGVPVLTSNTSSLPEVVGQAGVLVDPFDTNQISSKMQEILKRKELRQKLIAKGYRQSRKFTWSAAAAKLIKQIDGLSNCTSIDLKVNKKGY